ncbi:hypothetical protein BDY21DRAFT_277152, partial [Lineolata rhizophorae]
MTADNLAAQPLAAAAVEGGVSGGGGGGVVGDNGIALKRADEVRARELYKYFHPPEAPTVTPASKLDTPDPVLTAHAQLVTWRLDVQRAMISVIDRDTQHIIAESTKTLSLDNSGEFEEPGDGLWTGCISVPKNGRLCENTLTAVQPPDGGVPHFEVLDLSKDDRFNTSDFVTDGPKFRYYCGVPLTTKKNVNIGSLFAIDDRVRPSMSNAHKAFLAKMAENVMTHLEMLKDKADRERVLNMSMSMAAFVDPKHHIHKKRHRKMMRPSSPQQTRDRNAPQVSTKKDPKYKDDYHSNTFRRAASLLHGALELGDEGGIVFLDTATGLSFEKVNRPLAQTPESGPTTPQRPSFRRTISTDGAVNRDILEGSVPPASLVPDPASVLGCSTSEQQSPVSPSQRQRDFLPLTPTQLSDLIERHPRGKLFKLDGDDFLGSGTSGDEILDEGPYGVRRSEKSRPTKSEALLLQKHFPAAREIIFIPLWDSSSSRWSVFFAYNKSEFRMLSNTPDYLFCIAFCNCVMTETFRLATIASDKQKTDFIGSVSHELRSPLHGILASCEFLNDTRVDSFQRSLIDTADSCARTLLDTINMILDYSKINDFERNVGKARKPKRDMIAPAGGGSAAGGMQPIMNIYGHVDLAVITEEVVEGVHTGQVFRDFATDGHSGVGGKKVSPSKADVDIILDIEPHNWTYVTQPGAFRRVVMNLFGNALKYTKKGYIMVKLEVDDVDDEGNPTSVIILTVSDTGQGISPEYLRTRLFTPFSQESSLNPGTGLGLSLVRSIVVMLNGEINIRSTVDVGTEVTVKFPMARGLPDSATPSSPNSAGSVERMKDDSISVVQDE